MLDTDRAWLAGLFEGEGCISYDAKTVRLQIGMTDADIIARVQSLFPATTGIRTVDPSHNGSLGRKTQYRWCIRRAALVREFLALVGPWLGERRTAKARQALAFLDTRPGTSGDPKKRGATHCPQGHPYEGDNLYVRNGKRHCRTCGRDNSRGRMVRLREEARASGYDGTEPWHGTTGGYSNHACRCDACREANSAWHREYRRKRKLAAST